MLCLISNSNVLSRNFNDCYNACLLLLLFSVLFHSTIARCISVVAIKLAHLLFIYHHRFVKIAIVTAVGSSIDEAHTNYACIFVYAIIFVFIFVVCFNFFSLSSSFSLSLLLIVYHIGCFNLFAFTTNCAKRNSVAFAAINFFFLLLLMNIIFSDIFFLFYLKPIYIWPTLKNDVKYEKNSL